MTILLHHLSESHYLVTGIASVKRAFSQVFPTFRIDADGLEKVQWLLVPNEFPLVHGWVVRENTAILAEQEIVDKPLIVDSKRVRDAILLRQIVQANVGRRLQRIRRSDLVEAVAGARV
jgi:hypothetical protein